MELFILLFVIIGGSSPFLVAILNDGQIAGRTVKVVKANLNRNKQIVPGIVTADMKALEPRSRNTEAQQKLADLWQDAYDWFSIPDVVNELRIAKRTEAEREEYVAPEKAELERMEYRKQKTGNFYGMYELEHRARRYLEDEVERAEEMFPMTSDQAKALALSKKYGWELIDNDIIRLASQRQMPTFDYIALTSV